MKVAYLGKIQLSDVDLSYLHEAERLSDITYILEVTPRYLKGPAFNIEKIYPKSGLFKATEAYPEFSRLAGFVNLDHFYVLNTCGRLWQLKAFWTNFLLLLFLVRQKFGAIHWAWPPNVYEFPIYFLRKRMLLTVHDPFPHTAHDSFIVRLRRKMAFWLIPRLIILNKAQREDFINFYHIDPRRIIDSQLSCYTYLQCVKPDTAAAPTSRYLLFAGRISPYKGLDYLLPAMEKIHAELPDCKLIVAGGGKYHFDIAKYQAADYIDIRNRYIPDEELVALISNCAFMVCPYTDATQSGVIMSAYACRRPGRQHSHTVERPNTLGEFLTADRELLYSWRTFLDRNSPKALPCLFRNRSKIDYYYEDTDNRRFRLHRNECRGALCRQRLER